MDEAWEWALGHVRTEVPARMGGPGLLALHLGHGSHLDGKQTLVL